MTLITKADLLHLDAGLTIAARIPASVRFSYTVAFNRRVIAEEIEALKQANIAYNAAHTELCEEHAEKDDDGKPVFAPVLNGRRYSIVDQPAFDAALEALPARIEYEALLGEDCEFSLRTVRYSENHGENELPDGLTGDQISWLLPMIDDVDALS